MLETGILSFEPKGNYQLTASGVVVSPHLRMSELYFTKNSDALNYAKAKYSNALYDVEISKIEKILVSKR